MLVVLKRITLKTVITASLLGVISISPLMAQSFSEMVKPEVPAEVNSFPLNETFLQRMEAAQKQLNTMEMTGDDEAAAADHTPAALAAQIERKPEVKAVLTSHGLTPLDYILGYFALVSSLSAVEAENEEQVVDELQGINPAHIAFGKQFQDRIGRLLDE